jgi:hypothetical protein
VEKKGFLMRTSRETRRENNKDRRREMGTERGEGKRVLSHEK